ncbi:MAG: hypothetical protein IJV69_02870 [Kiritimatiellae bacterium]|nr:hypothetical protein [Kiritimatiellia bacterium]
MKCENAACQWHRADLPNGCQLFNQQQICACKSCLYRETKKKEKKGKKYGHATSRTMDGRGGHG